MESELAQAKRDVMSQGSFDAAASQPYTPVVAPELGS